MSRSSFHSLLNMLNTHDTAAADYKEMFPVCLLILLKFLGSQGNATLYTSIGCYLWIGYGSVSNYIKAAITMVLRLKDKVFFRPDINKREEISKRFNRDYSFVNCIGVVDGTIFPLEYKLLLNGEDYYNRKGRYGIHSLVICDDQARICASTMGWPGSVYDNRVWRRSRFMQNQEVYFNEKQYLLGDSAFHPSNIMVPPFKKPFGTELDKYKSFFNTMLAKPRIKPEHCIGLLKGKFPYLKRIRVLIIRRKDMIQINRILMVASILQNLMLSEDYPDK